MNERYVQADRVKLMIRISRLMTISRDEDDDNDDCEG